MLSAVFVSGLHSFTQHLTSGVLIWIHSADPCILVVACEDCVHMCSLRPFPASLIKDTTAMGANALNLTICVLLKCTVNTAQN